MKPLLFILVTMGLGILIALQFGEKATWFNYYAGAIAGLLISGAVLGRLSKKKRIRELEEAGKKRPGQAPNKP